MFFIFDWDGTLSDSASRIISCMHAAAEEAGVEVLSDDAVKNIIGLGLSEAFHYLYADLDEATEQKLKDAYASHFRARDTEPSKFFPNVLETLHTLRDDGYKLAVATGKSRRGLDRILESLNLGSFFHHSRCADETASKPNPLMLRELLEEASVPLAQTVMVGDTEWDMVMADNIGMKKIAVSYGAHDALRLKSFKPDDMVADFKDILAWRF